jgi:transcriptional regulator with XRE-family HTH domain
VTTMTARYRERRRAAIAAGTWKPRTDGTAVRAHLAQMRAAGATVPEIARASGLSRKTVAAIEAGDGKVMTATAAAILAVQVDAVDLRRSDAGGTRLRLQSLAAMGHTPTRAARATGLNPTYLREVAAGRVPEVPREVRQAVTEVYGAWWDKTPPEDTPAAARAATAVRHRAEREGWLHPAGLDDDCLDVPGYRPSPRRWMEAEGTGPAPQPRERELEAG